MSDLHDQLDHLHKRISEATKLLDLPHLAAELKKREIEMSDQGFWANPDHARQISAEADGLRTELETWRAMEKDVNDARELATLLEKEHDDGMAEELRKKTAELIKRFEHLEFYLLLGEQYDDRGALVAVHAGTGGVDAQDWAEMLFRMLSRYAESKGWIVRVMSESRGAEAGLKSAVLDVQGRYAYGYLKSESGVHRLVRISPFDAEKMRHTSFALVEVLPDLGDLEDVAIDDDDLKIDVFRSGGHGGQSVNTTDSAVRITHIPTGIVVGCQNERSQHQNKEFAMKMLKAKLHKLNEEARQQEKQKIRGEYTSAEWGNQVRSYVLHPYKLVKDHRTKYEEKDPEKVLNGGLDGFIEAYLRQRGKRTITNE
ncbi:MAG: peptide chain release factor 2 [Candidatus Kerfeldbacteria bacterium]|nr:peptide chain release factor 2 [Candidatus Kerfeldbacteria bacterium]